MQRKTKPEALSFEINLVRLARQVVEAHPDDAALSAGHERVARQLYCQHPAAAAFAGIEPTEFFVRSSWKAGKQHRALHARLLSGISIPIAFPAPLLSPELLFDLKLYHSLRCCVVSHLQRMTTAMRQLDNLHCERTGEAICPEQARVEHAAFEDVVRGWLKQRAERKLALPTPEHIRATRQGLLLTDSAMQEDWRHYHLHNARFELVDGRQFG